MPKNQSATLPGIILPGLLCVAIVFSIPAVSAADRDVPQSMLSLRDSLLRQRDYLLSRRSLCDYNLRDAEYVLKDLQNRANSADAQFREQLADSAFRMKYAVNQLYREKDNVERDLLYNDDDLRRVESDIKYYAGL